MAAMWGHRRPTRARPGPPLPSSRHSPVRRRTPSSPPPSSPVDAGLVSEEASFLEHRAALEATVLAPTEQEELVLELRAGVLRRTF